MALTKKKDVNAPEGFVEEIHGFRHFVRYLKGWGTDGEDRVERVTYCADSGSWYASVVHVANTGADWYEKSSANGTIEATLAWLEFDRAHAPKQRPKPMIYA